MFDIEEAYNKNKVVLRNVVAKFYPIISRDKLEQARGEAFENLPSALAKTWGDVLLGMAETEIDELARELVTQKIKARKAQAEYLVETYKATPQFAEVVIKHAKENSYAYSSNR
jgi:predicted Zn-dependent protease with MMP-like domain